MNMAMAMSVHHECPGVDQQVCRAVAQIRLADGAVFNVVPEGSTSVDLSALLGARARDLFDTADCCRDNVN